MADSPKSPTWYLTMVATAVVLLGASIGAFHYLRDSLAPKVARRARLQAGVDNVRHLATHLAWRANEANPTTLTGKRFILSLLADRSVLPDPENLKFFFSPADASRQVDAIPPERWQAVTREALAAGLPVDDLTSYVGPREVPTAFAEERVPLLADLHFPGGAIVGYSDGSTECVDLEHLGLELDDAMEVGPDAKSPILRHLSAE